MRYKKKQYIGQGGFGLVWRGLDTETKTEVLIKEIPIEGLTEKKEKLVRERIQREAYLPQYLGKRTDISQVLDVIEIENAWIWIIYRYVEGMDLWKLIRENEISLLQKLDIQLQLSTTLVALHKMGVAHRDIKAQNVLITTKLETLLIDFDSACMPDKKKNFLCTQILGFTPKSLAPEVWQYISEKERENLYIDWYKADIYALGILFYELTNEGDYPYEYETREDLVELLNSDIAPTTSHSSHTALDSLIMNMIQKDPQFRPNAKEVQHILSHIINEYSQQES